MISFSWFTLRPPLCLLVFLFATSIGIVFIHTYTLLQLKAQIYIAIGISIGIVAALIWLFLAHRESKSIKRKLHAHYIIQQNMKNQVLLKYLNLSAIFNKCTFNLLLFSFWRPDIRSSTNFRQRPVNQFQQDRHWPNHAWSPPRKHNNKNVK